MNIFGIVERCERESPHRPAVTYEGQIRTWAPRSVAVVEALPRTASGKVLKRQLREEHS